MLTSVLVVCSFAGLVTSSPLFNTTSTNETSVSEAYGVLLDAGSSSTKLKVYKWEHPDNNRGIPKLVPVDVENNRHKPGLGEFEDDRDGMANYLQQILQIAKDVIPAAYHSSTPIYCLATAGLRLLGSNDAGATMKMADEIFMDASINPFIYTPGSASVLSGEEEGIYAWIATNSLLNFFDKDVPITSSAGVLEMGGGSTQIAFVPKDGTILAEEFQVTLAGRTYSVYVQSYLRFGATEVKEKVVESLLAESGSDGSSPLDNPCLLEGDANKMTLNDGREIDLVGTGEPDLCRGIFRELLASDSPDECNLEPCAIGSVFQPSVEGIDFYAISAFMYPLKGVGAIDSKKVNGTILDLETLWTKTEEYCSKPKSEFPDYEYASSDCQGAVYIDTLLTEPYGFARDNKHIQVTSKIDGESIDWALGAMLHLLSMSFTNDPTHCSVKRR